MKITVKGRKMIDEFLRGRGDVRIADILSFIGEGGVKGNSWKDLREAYRKVIGDDPMITEEEFEEMLERGWVILDVEIL